MAADLGDADAMYGLGMYYYEGSYVTKDLVESVKWFRKAVDAGSIEAKEALKLLGHY
jgi:uncharacterized protein